MKKTLAQLGIPKTTFYRPLSADLPCKSPAGQRGATGTRPSARRGWNRIPDDIRDHVVELALEEPELPPRELAVRFTDTKRHYISEASVYRILKERDLLENYSLPGALDQAISQFIEHYNHLRCQESIGNVTPADAYFGRAPQILEERRKIKKETLKLRRLRNKAQAA